MTTQLRHSVSLAILLTAAIGSFIGGIILPVITIDQFYFFKDTFSVLSGIEALWHEKHRWLAVIVFVFSIVFPALKLSLLTYLWMRGTRDPMREGIVRMLGWMGRWSMLDVFVVAMTIVIAKLSGFADAKARIGIYLFGSSVILTMIAAWLIERPDRDSAGR